MTIVRIPTLFYDDHVFGRELPAPPPIKTTKQHIWIDTKHPDFAELMHDAKHYADPQGWGLGVWTTYGRAARALLVAVSKTN